jgi:copper chaperone
MTIQLKVSDMACDACAETIVKAVQSIDPTAQVQADLQTKQVMVESSVSESSVRKAIAAAGYSAA